MIHPCFNWSRPRSKNLSHVSNFRHGSNIVGSTWIEPGFFVAQRLNSWNLASVWLLFRTDWDCTHTHSLFHDIFYSNSTIQSEKKKSWFLSYTEAEFEEFERRLKFELWLKYSWFHLKLYSMFKDLSRCLI